MFQGRLLKCLILFITIVKCVSNFEVFVSKEKDDQHQSIVHVTSLHNQSYELSLFQKHYITIRTHGNDFRRNKTDHSKVIGFELQIQSTNPNIVRIEKETRASRENNSTNTFNTVLVEDLYISSRKGALGHIFNAYPSPTLIHPNQNSSDDLEINSLWSIEGVGMRTTNLTFRFDVFYDDDTSLAHIRSLSLLVTQPQRRIDTIFYLMIPFIVVSVSILMGILLDTDVIKSIFQKPTLVLVGFVAQYGLMPFLAMAIAKLFQYTPLNSLALFILGCCPGSGASNQWTVIFDGDVNLSAVMSFVSTTASFIMMPIYFYTIGKLYMNDLAIHVPFLGLARSLAMVVIPYSIGIAISYFLPKSRRIVEKLIKPIMIILQLFFLTFGLIVTWYLLKMIDVYTTLTAPLLPFLGFLLGGLLAWMSRASWKHIKTIGIEAGIQNTGIAFMIIMYSFPKRYSTEALIVPMIVAFLTTKPFWLILIIRNQIRKYQKNKELTKTSNIDGQLILTNDKPSENMREL